MSEIQILELSRAELAKNITIMPFPNETSYIFNSQAELFECNKKIGTIVVNSTVTKLGNTRLLNGNPTLVTLQGDLQFIFTTQKLTELGLIDDNQEIKCSINHATGIYERASSISITTLNDTKKTIVLIIVFKK